MMAEACGSPKDFYVIPGATHNDTYGIGGDEYFDRWRKFLDIIRPNPGGLP